MENAAITAQRIFRGTKRRKEEWQRIGRGLSLQMAKQELQQNYDDAQELYLPKTRPILAQIIFAEAYEIRELYDKVTHFTASKHLGKNFDTLLQGRANLIINGETFRKAALFEIDIKTVTAMLYV